MCSSSILVLIQKFPLFVNDSEISYYSYLIRRSFKFTVNEKSRKILSGTFQLSQTNHRVSPISALKTTGSRCPVSHAVLLHQFCLEYDHVPIEPCTSLQSS